MAMGALMPLLYPTGECSRPLAVRGREQFNLLRRSRRRAWSGPVRVQFVPAGGTDENRRAAFALPRRLGTAVERNRLRRRLRAVVAEVTPSVPPGAYLVGIDKGFRNLPYQELKARVIDAMQRAAKTAT